MLSGDNVTLSTTNANGTFASNGVGNAISVTVAGLTLGGAQASDYTLNQPTTTANITPASLTVSGISAENKVYNSTNAASLNSSGATLVGVFTGDTVTLDTSNTTGTFASDNAGTGIAVNVAGLTISGAQAGDYILSQPTLTANITPATLRVVVAVANKVYDGTASAILTSESLIGVIGTDAVGLIGGTAIFMDDHVGTDKTVTITGLSLTGPAANNYQLASSTVTTTAGILQGQSSIALTSSVGSTVYGEAATFGATVSAAEAPGGSVTFYDGTTPLGTVVLNGSGQAALTTQALDIGSHAIIATYSGDSELIGATSGATSVSVNRASTQVVLTPQPVFQKKKVIEVNLEVEVEPLSPGGGVPTGSVTFESIKKTGKKVKIATLDTATLGSGQATLSLKSKSVLNKTITINYGGDTDFLSSTATPPSVTEQSLKSLARPMTALSNRGHANP